VNASWPVLIERTIDDGKIAYANRLSTFAGSTIAVGDAG
jgi:hypothetical protein